MRIIAKKTPEEIGKYVGEIIINLIKEKPNTCMGLATGSSPIPVYSYLSNEYKNGRVDFSKAFTVNLDEYRGMKPEDDQSYRYFMEKNLFKEINIKPENTYVPNGILPEVEALDEFRLWLDKHPVDLQLLGIGVDGHIGFNEPGRAFSDRCCIEELDESTIKANSRFFEDSSMVPRKAITMGCGDIMRAEKIVLVAYDDNKINALKPLFGGNEITPENPATILKLHRDVTIVLTDELFEKM